MGDATLHRHGNTIPGPNGPPIVPFPRKHLALSAPGGALVLSPLETPLRMRGSGSGERSRGCPLCDPTNAMPANAGTHSGHLGTFSAAGRRLLIFVGSSYRPLLRMGELTQMCQLIPDIFSFPPCTAQKVNCPEGAREAPLEGFLFDVLKRKWGGAFRQAKPVSLRRFAASRQELSLCGSSENSGTFMKYPPDPKILLRFPRYGPSGPGGYPPAGGRTPPPSAPRPPA